MRPLCSIVLSCCTLDDTCTGGQGHNQARLHEGRHDLPGICAWHHFLFHEGFGFTFTFCFIKDLRISHFQSLGGKEQLLAEFPTIKEQVDNLTKSK